MKSSVPEAAPAGSPKDPLRIITATALFDGHDAAINVMRRVLQDQGAEVIHLGHNRSAAEIARAAVQEDAAAVAVSSYQGGHMEYFPYLLELLRAEGAGHIQVFGGGGGVIVPREIEALHACGVSRIYSPEDGRRLGLVGMIQDLLARTRASLAEPAMAPDISTTLDLARCISTIEQAKENDAGQLGEVMGTLPDAPSRPIPVLGITGTGGAGKSSLLDELVLRFLNDFSGLRVAVLSVDPTRRRTGGALLGDRIRMNAISDPRVYMRSLATRSRHSELSDVIGECVQVFKAAGFDLILVETAGIGQGDAGIVPLVDIPIYVMTAEFGAASQLEKIDMLDLADLVVINKFDRAGAEDALREVRKQVQRNRQAWDIAPEEMPVFGTMASRFHDDGVDALYQALLARCNERCGTEWSTSLPPPQGRCSSNQRPPIALERMHYLGEIARTLREYRAWVETQARSVRERWHLQSSAEISGDAKLSSKLLRLAASLQPQIAPECDALLKGFETLRQQYAQDELVHYVREKELRTPLKRESLSGTLVPRVSLPNWEDPGARLRWLLLENVPGRFPFTAGVFPFRRSDEDPTRMFAGEGDPARTNARFKLLSAGSEAKRLSTAFDSVTLYGWDPEERPDILGKVGSSGVSVCTLDDMKRLYDGFDLCSPNTSVSMTINGPAPAILAMFFNAAIDQQLDKFMSGHGRPPNMAEAIGTASNALRVIRGTVQADVLKEDQGQNTCIFAIDFALRMMGDVQEFFIRHEVRNFYSVSISGYHIAEAGANPISQLAFTLANGFTYVEHYLSRGMQINQFAPNLSFFFSCGMDPEYAVLNRVARRIWAVALRERYGADERAQKLKAHIQTSGRSLHAQDISFNDIRTTLEALTAWYDQCNSLHTNAFDEAVTTPTEGSVRRALAIQLIIGKEHGLSMNENSLQGSFIIDELTDLVEEAVLKEFERLDLRGGVLGAMERGYQRGKIQDESHRYEQRKSSGTYPIVGVNTFIDPEADHDRAMGGLELRRGTEEEKAGQLRRLREFQARHGEAAPAALARLKQVAVGGGNLFEELMKAVRVCSLGQITQALFEVGGQYRRNT